jgi:hypothetical protein
VQCPHCGKPTQAAATKATPPAENTPPQPQAESEAPAPRPPLTRQQRLERRRRLHLVLAIGGGVLLVATAYVLFLLSR